MKERQRQREAERRRRREGEADRGRGETAGPLLALGWEGGSQAPGSEATSLWVAVSLCDEKDRGRGNWGQEIQRSFIDVGRLRCGCLFQSRSLARCWAPEGGVGLDAAGRGEESSEPL